MHRIPLFFCSLFLCGVAYWFLYPYHFALPYFETDFVDYCIGVSQWNDWTEHFPPKRSRLAGLLAGVLGEYLGVLQGLSWAGVFSMTMVAILLTQWLERLRPLAGWSTLGWLLACSPWIGMGRFLNFYPTLTLGLLIGTVLVWLGLSKDVPQSSFTKGLSVGLGIGLCALIDARGLIWSGWFILLGLLWSLWQKESWRSVGIFWGGLLSMTSLGWYLGRFAYGPYSTSLVRQLDVRPLRMALVLDKDAISALPTEFRWGWEWHGVFDNLLFLLCQQTEGLPSGAPSVYWWLWLGGLLLGILMICRKHLLLVLVLCPSLLAFLQIGHAVEEHLRFYLQTLPMLMGILGLTTSYLLPTSTKGRIVTLGGLIILLPYVSLFGPHWNIEREISHKMLNQAHPNHPDLQQRTIVYGTPIHIQTLPVTEIERQITQNWDRMCTEALQQHPPTLWFETIKDKE